jgi:hypothetical protein
VPNPPRIVVFDIDRGGENVLFAEYSIPWLILDAPVMVTLFMVIVVAVFEKLSEIDIAEAAEAGTVIAVSVIDTILTGPEEKRIPYVLFSTNTQLEIVISVRLAVDEKPVPQRIIVKSSIVTTVFDEETVKPVEFEYRRLLLNAINEAASA